MLDKMREIIDIGGAFEALINWLTHNFDGFFDLIGAMVEAVLSGFNIVLSFPHPVVMFIVLAALAWYVSGKGVGIFSAIGFPLIWYMGLWSATMDTLSLVIASVFIALIVGVPLGVLASKSDTAWRVIRPTL